MASKKAGGSSSNGRDSNPKYLGLKVSQNQVINAGTIIIRQRGTKIYAGSNVGMGRDHTLFAKISGKLHFNSRDCRKYANVVQIENNIK